MSTPHYVRDYNALVDRLLREHPLDEAMSIAVGGNYHGMGEKLAQFLLDLGLDDTHTLVDVGCGSGRVPVALRSSGWQGVYHGIDVSQAMLDYAKTKFEHWTFHHVAGLYIPRAVPLADVVAFFSVFTHLKPEESYVYLLEAKRVLKPGGYIVVSFLDYRKHWDIFHEMCLQAASGTEPEHLNTFLEMETLITWCERADLKILCEADLGQRVVVLTHA